MTLHCSEGALLEPLAGSAPVESHWLFVEAPGAWGRDALLGSDAVQRAWPRGLPEQWRVVLVRRADRPLRRQHDRMVWLSTPGEVLQWLLPPDAPVAPDALPRGRRVDEEVLFVCTNGARDRCCALRGRSLLSQLAGEQVWECSHLGGHRFAPTGVRLGDRMVFGRLDAAAARDVLAGRTPLDHLRGPAGWPAPVQAAAAAVWRHHGPVPIAAAEHSGDTVRLALSDGTVWNVDITWSKLAARPLSCGADPVAGKVPVAAGAAAVIPGAATRMHD